MATSTGSPVSGRDARAASSSTSSGARPPAGGDREHTHQVADRDLQRRARGRSAGVGTHELAAEGVAAREHDPQRGLAGEEARPRETPVIAVHGRLVARRHGGDRVLAYRIRFAGQRRLLGLQLRAGDDHSVGREVVAGPDRREIARQHGCRRHGPRHPVARRPRLRGEPRGESPRRGGDAPVQQRVHADQRQHRQEEGDRLRAVAERGVDRGRDGEEPQHRVRRSVARHRPPGPGDVFDDVVGRVDAPACLHLRGRQAGARDAAGRQPRQRAPAQGRLPPSARGDELDARRDGRHHAPGILKESISSSRCRSAQATAWARRRRLLAA